MNTNFKVGDKVTPTDVRGNIFITEGKEYIVYNVCIGDLIKLEKDDTGDESSYYPSSLFKIVQKKEERVTNDKGGVKADGLKLRYDLIPILCEKEVVKVLTYGANKYDDDNWKKVEPERYIGAIRRHLAQYQEGEILDSESGMHHLAHAISSLMFIMYHDLDREYNQGEF